MRKRRVEIKYHGGSWVDCRSFWVGGSGKAEVRRQYYYLTDRRWAEAKDALTPREQDEALSLIDELYMMLRGPK